MEYVCPQTLNDKWLIESLFHGKRNGFFVEAGGADGIIESSTYLLEKHFDWHGIIAEPTTAFYSQLLLNRTSKCINVALSGTDGTTSFITSSERCLSGIESNISEWHKPNIFRKEFVRHVVTTVTLNTLLIQNQAPFSIDLIHLDIEGSEYEVLKNFQFDKYFVKLFIIENSNAEIKPLMIQNGFVEILNHYNVDCPWENYYLNKKIVDL